MPQFFILHFLCFFLLSCSTCDRQVADGFNSLSYAYHYRDLDSTEHYARKALQSAATYSTGQAEALNNLAFASILRMRYDEAQHQLDTIFGLTDNQLELLVAHVQYMRLCQRRSNNREFYAYRERAIQALKRINEDRSSLTPRQSLRLLYAESEMAIVTSTYYYYVGLHQQSADELMHLHLDLDSAQLMNYLYNVGAGGIITDGSPIEIEQKEFDCLLQCYLLARSFGSPFFVANSMEAIADHLIQADRRSRLLANNPMAADVLNERVVSADKLPIYLADSALSLFRDFGDVYQIAGAHRTLASCYLEQNDYELALNNLEMALADSAINQAPDLVASIREQLSVAFSAVNDKMLSDRNRNIYLDLQEQTRQDRWLEARAGQLDAAVAHLNLLLLAVFAAFIVLFVSLWLFYRLHRRWLLRQEQLDELKEEREEIEEQLAIVRQKKRQSERRNLEQRAKISLVVSITPLIDRMLHEVKRIDGDSQHRDERQQYVRELTDTINEQNNMLTHWIQLRQGELCLNIETFALQELFDIIEKGRRSFQLKDVTLDVHPTTARVKADRVLTLFMINTLADNARKFTDRHGRVSVYAVEESHYVEISVADTGCGLDADQLSHVFDHKVVAGHGFGLQNCRGIIEKYKKTSRIFSVCLLSAESRLGQGSRFFFRLPKGIVRLVVFLAVVFSVHVSSMAAVATRPGPLQMASALADSAYFSNIRGDYGGTLRFADSCCYYLNAFYRQLHPQSTDTLCLYDASPRSVADILWVSNGVQFNYSILLTLRNECAVAALALHEWQLYNYNNRIYTQLFKELSADRSLDEYCRKMQQSQANVTVAVILLIVLLLALLVAILIQVLQVMERRASRQQQQRESLEQLVEEVHRTEMELGRLHVSNQVLENCLSALKHETMYYPSRIRQLIDSGDTTSLPEVTGYYRELYGILSEQAERQVKVTKLRLQRLDHDILGDENMIALLFDILRRKSGLRQLDVTYSTPDESYVMCQVPLPGVPLTDFTPTIDNIPYLLCRQIIREHGEATGRRGCGIRAEAMADGMKLFIILPRQVLTDRLRNR